MQINESMILKNADDLKFWSVQIRTSVEFNWTIIFKNTQLFCDAISHFDYKLFFEEASEKYKMIGVFSKIFGEFAYEFTLWTARCEHRWEQQYLLLVHFYYLWTNAGFPASTYS